MEAREMEWMWKDIPLEKLTDSRIFLVLHYSKPWFLDHPVCQLLAKIKLGSIIIISVVGGTDENDAFFLFRKNNTFL